MIPMEVIGMLTHWVTNKMPATKMMVSRTRASEGMMRPF